jgi:hypothetical protein
LEIQLIDNELNINSHWPNGCRLIPEGAARFQLQSTKSERDMGKNDAIF